MDARQFTKAVLSFLLLFHLFPYEQASFWDSNREIFRQACSLNHCLRNLPAAISSFEAFKSFLCCAALRFLYAFWLVRLPAQVRASCASTPAFVSVPYLFVRDLSWFASSGFPWSACLFCWHLAFAYCLFWDFDFSFVLLATDMKSCSKTGRQWRTCYSCAGCDHWSAQECSWRCGKCWCHRPRGGWILDQPGCCWYCLSRCLWRSGNQAHF